MTEQFFASKLWSILCSKLNYVAPKYTSAISSDSEWFLDALKSCMIIDIDVAYLRQVAIDITFKFNKAYLNDMIEETKLDISSNMERSTEGEDDEDEDEDKDKDVEDCYPHIRAHYVTRMSKKKRSEWFCTIRRKHPRPMQTWYELNNCGHRFHVTCIGK